MIKLGRFLTIFLFIFNVTHAQEVPKLRIDPAQALGGPASNYFESVEYIPLESSKESLFGDAHTVIITDSSIVVYDVDTKSILFFDLNGKFIRRIRENNSYMRVGYDREKNCIISTLTDLYPEETKTYSLFGRLLDKTIDKSQAAEEVINKIPIGNGYVAKANNHYLYGRKKPTDSLGYLVDIYKNKSIYNHFFPIIQTRNLLFSKMIGQIWLPNVIENGCFYVSVGLDYNLYKVSKDSSIKIYQFVFPANRSIPKEYIKSTDIDVVDSVKMHLSPTNTILGLSNIFFVKNRLFFKINVGEYIFDQTTQSTAIYNFIYDTITHGLVAFERITPDLMTSYLPLFNDNVKLYGLVYHSGYFYSTISSLDLFTAYEKNKSRNPQYPQVLQEYFKTQNRKSNLVIVKMKLKDF